MHVLGYHPERSGKGYYTDDHNRADIISYRQNEFLPHMLELENRMDQFVGEGLIERISGPAVSAEVKKVVLITHDESTFYSNEGVSFMWMENRKKALKPKSLGSSIMISAFVSDVQGVESYVTFKAGTNRDGWFTNDDLIAQMERDLPMIEERYPKDEYDIVFAFDNSMTHHKRPPDGLDASLLPLKDGGKNAPKMRDTTFVNSRGETIAQRMQNAKGEQKGLKSILEERGLWDTSMRLQCTMCKEGVPHSERQARYPALENGSRIFTVRCCASYCLSQQPDFLAQREWLREWIEDRGHSLIWYPKYHCELNFLEMIWAYIKAKLRKLCNYNFAEFEEILPQVLENLPMEFVRKVKNHCFRAMSAYRIGMEGPLLDYAIRKYKSHRRIPEMLYDQIKDEYYKWVAAKEKRR